MTDGGVSAAWAGRLAARSWRLEARTEVLAGEFDRNFLLTAGDGRRFVLKVAPPTAVSEHLECQLAVMERLAVSAVAHLVQRPLPAADGRLLVEVDDLEGRPRLVRVVSYLGGEALARVAERPMPLLETIGRGLARLDLALEQFDHPGAHRPLFWDLEAAASLGRFLDAVDDPGRRRLVAGRLERFEAEVRPRLAALPRGVIHNDANDHNLLVTGRGGALRLAGIIDFGDLLATVTAAELAIAVTYLMLDRPDPLADAAAAIRGYHSVRPLDDGERSLLPELVTARLCASVLMAAHGRRREPGNRYLQISEAPVWRLLEGMSDDLRQHLADTVEAACRSAGRSRTAGEILAVRRRHLGRNLSVSYAEPLKIVRGEGQYLFDEDGRRYLDLVNNVCHVGHCHPRVVAAGQRQMAALNTNTRYLHDHLAEYALRLTATLPEPLEVCFFCCSGTEANDLALRLARAGTGTREIVVLEHAYHGHSPSLVEISTYKCEGPGGEGLAAHAHKVPMPDPYRGPHRGADAGRRYAEEVAAKVARLVGEGRPPGAFLAESLIGCGGQVIPPPGFLPDAHRAARAAGAVCIADEVQVGFGRAGSHFWAFSALGATPDVVTLGKPIGNGHPMAAVVTTADIADAFDTGMEFFSTFGGNPVSCAIGLAVLDVIEEEGLQARAAALGAELLDGLAELGARHRLIGDVRGLGLFLGVELVRDRDTLAPAPTEAAAVVEVLRRRGFLLATDGPLHNVLKLKPPMVLTRDDVAALLGALDEVLAEVEAMP